MTRPQMIRADTMDLQSRDAPSAQDHSALHSPPPTRRDPNQLSIKTVNSSDEVRQDILASSTQSNGGYQTNEYDLQNGNESESEMLDTDEEDLMNAEEMSSTSPSIDNEDIDFEFVYALHTFQATVEGQANAVKGDTMVLLDDSNSYWWLVRIVKDSSIGYLPAEHIETPSERLARLNKHRNMDLASTMLADTIEKPKKGGLLHRKKKPRNVAFTAPFFTIVEYQVEDSEDEEYPTNDEDDEAGDDSKDGDQKQEAQQTEPVTIYSEPDEITAVVEPEPVQRTYNNASNTGGLAGQPAMGRIMIGNDTVKTISSAEQQKKSLESERRTVNLVLADGQADKSAALENGKPEFKLRTRGNTDSAFFGDETMKISLTPAVARYQEEGREEASSTNSSPVTTLSNNSSLKELGRGSLDKLQKRDDVLSPPPGSKTKEKLKKAGVLGGLFRRRKGRKSDEDDLDSFLHSEKDKKSSESQREAEAALERERIEQEKKVKEEQARKQLEAQQQAQQQRELEMRKEAEQRREAELKRRELEQRQKAEAEQRRREADQKRKEIEQRQRIEAEQKQRMEAEMKRQEEEAKARAEAEEQARIEAERKRQEEEERLRLEEERKQREIEEARRKQEEERKRLEEERRRQEEEEAERKRLEEEERKRREQEEEEERRRREKEEEEARIREEEEQRRRETEQEMLLQKKIQEELAMKRDEEQKRQQQLRLDQQRLYEQRQQEQRKLQLGQQVGSSTSNRPTRQNSLMQGFQSFNGFRSITPTNGVLSAHQGQDDRSITPTSSGANGYQNGYSNNSGSETPTNPAIQTVRSGTPTRAHTPTMLPAVLRVGMDSSHTKSRSNSKESNHGVMSPGGSIPPKSSLRVDTYDKIGFQKSNPSDHSPISPMEDNTPHAGTNGHDENNGDYDSHGLYHRDSPMGRSRLSLNGGPSSVLSKSVAGSTRVGNAAQRRFPIKAEHTTMPARSSSMESRASRATPNSAQSSKASLAETIDRVTESPEEEESQDDHSNGSQSRTQSFETPRVASNAGPQNPERKVSSSAKQPYLSKLNDMKPKSTASMKSSKSYKVGAEVYQTPDFQKLLGELRASPPKREEDGEWDDAEYQKFLNDDSGEIQAMLGRIYDIPEDVKQRIENANPADEPGFEGFSLAMKQLEDLESRLDKVFQDFFLETAGVDPFQDPDAIISPEERKHRDKWIEEQKRKLGTDDITKIPIYQPVVGKPNESGMFPKPNVTPQSPPRNKQPVDLSMLSSPNGPRSNDVPQPQYRKETNPQYQSFMNQPPVQQRQPQEQPQPQQQYQQQYQQYQQQAVPRKMSQDQYQQQIQQQQALPPRQTSRQGSRDQYPTRQASQDSYAQQQYVRPQPQQQYTGYQQQQQAYGSYRSFAPSGPLSGPPTSAPPAPPANSAPSQPIPRPRNRS